MKRHLIVPDLQLKKGVPMDHLRWIGKAIAEYKPDRLINLGDTWDMPSLSRHEEKGSLATEGARVEDDILAGNTGMEILEEYGAKTCEDKTILRGNHEQRIERAINADPRLSGTIGYHMFNDSRMGWHIVDYFCGAPGQIALDGVVYAHYFAAVNTGRPIGGTASNKLNHIGESFVQGHVQGYEVGTKQYSTGRIRKGMVAGSCYLHDESYKGMANNHWRGIVILNEVNKGDYCEMPLSLDYLCRKYEGRSLGSYLRRNYKNATKRFTLARNLP